VTGPEPSTEPVPPEPPFYIVIDRSIPPDEVHFRQHGKTVAVMKLGEGQVLTLPRKVDQTVPFVGSLLSAVKLDERLP
jgi:hypothetical protein